jgi:hypothetical protein
VKYGLLSVFLNARNVKPADNHRQICEVYCENAVNDGMLRNVLECSMKVVLRCMRSRGASCLVLSQAATFYEEGVQKLVPRYYECLNNSKNYVEK